MIDVDIELEPVRGLLEQADQALLAGEDPHDRVWPTGFDPLDQTLNGGLRSGELVLLGGPQGLGKTTLVLQVARNVVRSGRPALVFSFEHDARTLLVRLVALEAGEIGGIVAPGVNRIRATFEDADGRTGPVRSRLADTECGVEAVEAVEAYGDKLLLHRSTGTSTGLGHITAAIHAVRERTGALPLVVVDYLQKVHVPDATDEYERITTVAEGLKDLALDHDVPVLAVVASDKEGLTAGRRLRVAQPARLLRAGLRGRHGAAAQRQVRRRGPPPPRLQHDQRRAFRTGRCSRWRRTAAAARASTWSSTSASTSAGSTPPAGTSPSSWSTSASSSSRRPTTPPPTGRWRRRSGVVVAGVLALRPRRPGDVAGPVRVDLDAGAHRRGDRDLLR